MKPESRLLRSRRLRIVILSVLISLGPLALIPKPARSQPAGEALAQIQELRQLLAQLLATYQSAKPEVRAELDRGLAMTYVPSLQQWYNSLPTSCRTDLDNQIRQKTGYTFPQLIRMSSTVPGLVKALNLVADVAQGVLGGAKPGQPKELAASAKPESTSKPATPAAPVTPKAPAKPPTTLPPSGKAGSKPPSNGGAVDLSGTKELKLKLGWVLFGRTDLTDEQAQAIYDEKVKKRVTALDADMAAATQRLERAKQRLELFDEAGEKTGLQRIVNALKDDLKEAKDERTKAMKDLASLVALETAKKGAGKAIKGSEDVLDVLAAGPGAYDVAALAQKANRTREDWEKAGEGFVSILTAASTAKKLTAPGAVATVAGAAADAIYLYLADRRVRMLENCLAQTTTQTEEYRSRLLQQVQMETDRIDALRREKEALVSKKYLDLRLVP